VPASCIARREHDLGSAACEAVRVRLHLALLFALGACGRLNFAPVGGDDDDDGNGDARGDGRGDGVPTFGANIMFVTAADVVPGTLGGLANADARCQAEAAAAGLEGEYVAWMSTTTQVASSRVAGSRGWVRPDGMPVADMPGMFTTHLWTPPSVMADGTDLTFAPATQAVTGANISGGLSDYGTCTDWTSTSSQQTPGRVTSTWQWADNLNFDSIGCGASTRIYCLGVGETVAVSITPVAGRRAFLSGLQPSGGGTTGFDTVCANEAASQGLGGQWRALIADSTTTAAARFDGFGPPWVRLDGIPLAPTAQDLLTTGFRVPLDQLVDGTYAMGMIAPVWIGAPSLTAAATLSCSNWTSASPSGDAAAGEFTNAGNLAVARATLGCQAMARLYCLER
jgi:hypothetical protein